MIKISKQTKSFMIKPMPKIAIKNIMMAPTIPYSRIFICKNDK